MNTRQTTRSREEGMALILVVLAVIAILGAVTLVVGRVQSTKRNTDATVNRAMAEEACKAGIDMAIERIWNQYVLTTGNTTGNLASYRLFVSNLIQNNEDTNNNGVQDAGEFDSDGDGGFDMNPPWVVVTDDQPVALASGGGIRSVTVSRTDDLTGAVLTIRSTGRYGDTERTAVQTVRVGGEPFEGFEYGILANNINCILCHAKFYSLDLARNTNPSNYNSFDRIKVAALESLMIRTNENIHTRVAGTIYTRGTVYNQTGAQLSANSIASSTLRAFQFNNTNGKIVQNSSGAMSETSFANATTNSQGLLNPFSNLYLNYPDDRQYQTDGTLPTHFPAPYPDDNENRYVDDDEFDRVVNSANGRLQFTVDPNQPGSLQAGVAYGVPHGSAYAGTSLPTSSNGALSSLSTDGSYEGNLILIGTNDDPIVIDGAVAVDGDLVIKGPVKGWGQIFARGNVYVVGDVTYADAPGEFGVASDGTRNGLALTSGGSIMMGDYLTIRGKQHTAETTKFPGGGFIDTRTANRNVTISKSGSSNQTHAIGYFDSGVTDAGWTVNNQPQLSFTTSELMLFNQQEYLRKQADSTYKPRYYRLRPDQPIYRYSANDEHTVKYTDAGVQIITNPGDAAIHDLNPNNFWLTESALRNFWWTDEMTRPSSGRPMKFDGLLYSNNSIFAITRSSDRHKSNTRGRMEVRGSIVTSDLGVLVPGPDFSVPRSALDLYYDRRVADFLRVEDTTVVQYNRLAFRFEQ
ncbi:MAG: hypothetical protein AMXMBFR84_11870 [Candidatus Hydrogenedentota bacterium]